MALEVLQGKKGNVETRVVISRPGPVTELTSAQSPDIPEISLLVQHLSAGRILSSFCFAMKAALGCPRLAHVHHLEIIPLKQLPNGRGWPRGSSLGVVPCAVAECNDHLFLLRLGDLHLRHERLHHVGLAPLLQTVGVEALLSEHSLGVEPFHMRFVTRHQDDVFSKEQWIHRFAVEV